MQQGQIQPFTHIHRSMARFVALCALFICCAWGSSHTAQAADTEPPRLFGTVEFKSSFKKMPSWLGVLQRNQNDPLLTPTAKLKGNVEWEAFKAKLAKLSPLDQIKQVNSFWNKWPYRQDKDVYKKEDYWATPKEFHQNSGDCEDYCIAKYFTLKELGFDINSMRIVVVRETIRNIGHAILAVYIDNEVYILDNLNPNVLPQGRLKNYQPQFSVNEQYRWAHVRPK